MQRAKDNLAKQMAQLGHVNHGVEMPGEKMDRGLPDGVDVEEMADATEREEESLQKKENEWKKERASKAKKFEALKAQIAALGGD